MLTSSWLTTLIQTAHRFDAVTVTLAVLQRRVQTLLSVLMVRVISGSYGQRMTADLRWAGLWTSMLGTFNDDHQITPQKTLDPKQYSGPGGDGTFHEYLTVSSCD